MTDDLLVVLVADPAYWGLDDTAPAVESRLLGMSLVWRAVLRADRLGAREVFVVGDRGLVAGIATEHRLSAAVSSGTLDDLRTHLARRPARPVLLSGPWLLIAPRQLAALAEHGRAEITIGLVRGIDPVRPWPEVLLQEVAVGRIGRHLEGASAQALPLVAGTAEALTPLVTDEPDVLARVPAGTRAVLMPPGDVVPLLSAADLPRAARFLLASVGSSADGLVDRFVNRRLSRLLTLWVIDHRITPNEITGAALALGLAAVACIMTGSYGLVIAGAVLLQISAIVDCVDGEVARLKHLESRWGAHLDLIADNVVHVALFLAIGRAVSTHHGNLALQLGAAAAAGALVSFLLVWSTMLGRRATSSSRVQRFVDRMTNRDFTALLLACAVADRLHWFLWALAIGVQVFWMVLAGLKVHAFWAERLGGAASPGIAAGAKEP